MRSHQTRFWKAGVIANARTAGVVDANRATPPPPHRAAKDRKIALAIFGLVVAVCQAGTTIRGQGAPVEFLQICGETSSFIIPGHLRRRQPNRGESNWSRQTSIDRVHRHCDVGSARRAFRSRPCQFRGLDPRSVVREQVRGGPVGIAAASRQSDAFHRYRGGKRRGLRCVRRNNAINHRATEPRTDVGPVLRAWQNGPDLFVVRFDRSRHRPENKG